MNHGNSLRKFSRTSAHRKAMLRNLATALVLNDQIKTTLPKAKELKRVADKLVTIGKKNTLAARRQAMGFLVAQNREEHGNNEKWTAVHKLFAEIAPRYDGRNGGYTRVVKLTPRLGDKAPMAIIEFVEAETSSKGESKRKRRVAKKTPVAEKSSESASETASA